MLGLGGRRQPQGAIDLTPYAGQLGDAREVMRVFVAREQEITGGIYIDPPEGFTPFMMGILIADIVHHAAKAYAHAFGVDAAAALYEISDGLSAELRRPTAGVQQVNLEPDG